MMEKILGIPTDMLMTVLLVIFALGVVVVGVLALRNRVVFKMGVRNVPRRRAQTALIVMGLMLATLLFSASFTTGDTLVHSNRVQALKGIGEVDVQVQPAAVARTELDNILGGAGRPSAYFDQAVAARVRDRLASDPEVEGVAPLASESAPVAAPASGQSEPSVSVLGLDPVARGFDALTTADGEQLALNTLQPGQAYISAALAEELGARTGQKLRLFLAERPRELSVAGVYEKGAAPAGELSLVMPLARLQQLTGNEGKINGVLITHRGEAVKGAEHTDATLKALAPVLAGTGLEAVPVKRDALERADRDGRSFADIFTLFGGFSIAAGVLLIFLIFVMLAAERKRELGIARGVGMQRRHVVRMFTFEGAVYSLIAAAVGSALGVATGWLMVRVVSAAFGSFDIPITFDFQWRSLVIAYTLGMVITFAVVLVSSWRVSRINVVRAIRDIPEPRLGKKTVRGLVLALLLLAAGLGVTALGWQAANIAPYMLGTSLLIIGAALLARRFGLPDRAAFTAAGVTLLVWWLLPNSAFDAITPEAMDDTGGIEMFFLSGIMIVIAAVWVVVYNSDLLLAGIVAVFGHVKGLPPVLKTAVSYPMQNRFRTGMTLAMISLVMFTLVVMSFITSSFAGIWADTDRWGGGYDVRASTGYTNPITDMPASLRQVEGLRPEDVMSVGSFSGAPVRARASGGVAEPKDILVQAADKGYTDTVAYTFRSKAEGYDTDRDVWRALQDDPNTVVVSAVTVPPRTAGFGEQPPAIRFGGFYREDAVVPASAYVEVRDPRTGRATRLRVLGVLDDAALYTGDVLTSQKTLNALAGQPVPAQSYFFELREGVDAPAAAKALERHFAPNGMQAQPIRQEIDKIASANTMINSLLQGFMALGLIVGIAALGVIAARAVVERRQQIGVMRAMGFQKGQVQLSFLLESSYVALLGIGIGVALGMALSRNVIDGFAEQVRGVTYNVPWAQLLVIVAVAYLASLLTTYLPARQASKVYPAEALRYE